MIVYEVWHKGKFKAYSTTSKKEAKVYGSSRWDNKFKIQAVEVDDLSGYDSRKEIMYEFLHVGEKDGFDIKTIMTIDEYNLYSYKYDLLMDNLENISKLLNTNLKKKYKKCIKTLINKLQYKENSGKLNTARLFTAIVIFKEGGKY